MRSSIVWVALLVASVVLMGVIQGFSGQDKSSCFGEEKYALKAPEGVESRRGPVNFPRQAHLILKYGLIPAQDPNTAGLA